MGRGVLLTSNLPQLQNLIKRDPVAYKEEFLQQWNHYNSIRQIFKINPEEQAQHFRELVSFIAQVCASRVYIRSKVDMDNVQVAQCYPKQTADFPSHMSSLLLESYGTLSPDTRRSLVQNLVMLRNKDVITSIEYVPSHLTYYTFDPTTHQLQIAENTLPSPPLHNLFLSPRLHSTDHPLRHPHRESAYEESQA